MLALSRHRSSPNRLLCSWLGKTCSHGQWIEAMTLKVMSYCFQKKWNKTHLLDCPIALDFVPAFLSPCWWVFYTSSPDCSWQGQKGFCSKSTQIVCDSYSHRILCLGNDGILLIALFSPEYLWFLLVPGWWDWGPEAGAGASLIFSAL